MRQAAGQHGAPAAGQCPMQPSRAPTVYQVQSANGAGTGAPQSRVSPVSQMQTVAANQSPSPTTMAHSCTTAALSSVCTPIHNHHPGIHNPLHNLVYVHTYYEGPYVPIYVRT